MRVGEEYRLALVGGVFIVGRRMDEIRRAVAVLPKVPAPATEIVKDPRRIAETPGLGIDEIASHLADHHGQIRLQAPAPPKRHLRSESRAAGTSGHDPRAWGLSYSTSFAALNRRAAPQGITEVGQLGATTRIRGPRMYSPGGVGSTVWPPRSGRPTGGPPAAVMASPPRADDVNRPHGR